MRLYSLLKVIFVFLFVFSAYSLSTSTSAQTTPELCPGQGRGGQQLESKLGETSGALVEEDTCSGILGQLACFVNSFLWGKQTEDGGKTTFSNSTMPYYLRIANQLLLSANPEVDGSFDKKKEEPGGITGSLAKLAPPNGFNDEEILKTLYRSEGKLVAGTIILNQEDEQTKFNKEVGTDYGETSGGFYDRAAGESYLIPARFGEVSPLADRFGILKQALFPPGEEVSVNSSNCAAYDDEGNILFDPTPIDVTYLPNPDPEFFTDWTAAWKIKKVDEADVEQQCTNPENPDTCSETVSATGGAGGNLDTTSKVSLTGTAWERIGAKPREDEPNSGGVYNLLLLPDQSFPTLDAEAGVGYNYDAVQGSGSGGTAKLFVAELGNVEGALDCIINGITANPWQANPAACANAFAGLPPASPIGGGGTGKGSCEEWGWPTEHGYIFEGSFVGTHSRIEAIDIFGVPMGEPICATFSGVVTGDNDNNPTTNGNYVNSGVYGNWITIKADNPIGSARTLVAIYGHMLSRTVRAGQHVAVGDIIGYVGDTGMGGTHLHYEWSLGSGTICTGGSSRPGFCPMQPPFIPEPVPYRCNGKEACGVEW